MGMLKSEHDAILLAWAKALDLREHGRAGHSLRVAELTARIGRAMGLPEDKVTQAYRGALLHDVGMLIVPDRVLHGTGPLNPDEWALVRRHPAHAREILEEFGILQEILAIPYSHHERMDGSGYPEHLHGQQIPMEARIFAVADAWDSLLSPRPYRPGWTRERARAYIQLRSADHFDPDVVRVFLGLPEILQTAP